MILRTLAQESPNLELRLKRYGRKKFGGLKLEFGKLYGFIWNFTEFLVDWKYDL
jgi:hypothetical protein